MTDMGAIVGCFSQNITGEFDPKLSDVISDHKMSLHLPLHMTVV